ncbi:hypothetical protein M405DRAFT_233876 [Rhizopogon salebrosus TDB-379]|nr:hypothetical protein M405DRAFT_233876 [Rhizopogon salebrosus TDB-379]
MPERGTRATTWASKEGCVSFQSKSVTFDVPIQLSPPWICCVCSCVTTSRARKTYREFRKAVHLQPAAGLPRICRVVSLHANVRGHGIINYGGSPECVKMKASSSSTFHCMSNGVVSDTSSTGRGVSNQTKIDPRHCDSLLDRTSKRS